MNLQDIFRHFRPKCVHYWVHDDLVTGPGVALLTARMRLIDSSVVE